MARTIEGQAAAMMNQIVITKRDLPQMISRLDAGDDDTKRAVAEGLESYAASLTSSASLGGAFAAHTKEELLAVVSAQFDRMASLATQHQELTAVAAEAKADARKAPLLRAKLVEIQDTIEGRVRT